MQINKSKWLAVFCSAIFFMAGGVNGQTVVDDGDGLLVTEQTHVTINSSVTIQPEELVNVDEAVNVEIGVQLPSFEDTGNPNTFFVVQLTGDADVVTTETKAGGVEALINGNVTLSGIEETETTVSYIRAVRIELEVGTLIPQGAPIPVGGYINGDGQFVELGEMSGIDAATGAPIFSPADFAAMDPDDLALITGDPVTSFLGGGNLNVGGDAQIDNDATVGGNLDVDGAISGNSLAIVSDASVGGNLDVDGAISGDSLAIVSDASVGGNLDVDGAISGNSLAIVSDASVGGNLDVAGNATVVGDFSAAGGNFTVDAAGARVGNILTVGPNSVVIDGPANWIYSSQASGNLLVGTPGVGAVQIQNDLRVAGNTALAGNLTVGGNTTLNGNLAVTGNADVGGNLAVGGDARIAGRLSVGGIQDVEATFNSHDARIAANTRRIAQNRQMIMENREMIQRVDKKVDKVKGKAYSGIAAAASLDAFVTPSAPGKTTVMGGVAYYEGESALGVTATHYLSVLEDQKVYVNAGVSVTTDETVLVRALAGIEF
jgi:predicted acyltransferase (DUF342 family)